MNYCRLLGFVILLIFVGQLQAAPASNRTQFKTQAINVLSGELLQGANRPFDDEQRDRRPLSRSRIVLANTREQGVVDWGVGADQAELACQRIANRGEAGSRDEELGQAASPFNSLLGSMLGGMLLSGGRGRHAHFYQHSYVPKPMTGHLLSISEVDEMESIMQVLNPVPSGPFWTGGRLSRRRDTANPTSGVPVVSLKWTDGKRSTVDVLSMTEQDSGTLRLDFDYCISFDFSSATWQARDCSDRLPYICRVSPKSFTFSNHLHQNGDVEVSTTSAPRERPPTPANVQPPPEPADRIEMVTSVEPQETTSASLTFTLLPQSTSATEEPEPTTEANSTETGAPEAFSGQVGDEEENEQSIETTQEPEISTTKEQPAPTTTIGEEEGTPEDDMAAVNSDALENERTTEAVAGDQSAEAETTVEPSIDQTAEVASPEQTEIAEGEPSGVESEASIPVLREETVSSE